jgi:hypothetical protein
MSGRTAGCRGPRQIGSDQRGAAWVRVSRSTVGDQVQVTGQGGRNGTATVDDGVSARQYGPTSMIAADRHSQVRACLERGGQRRRTSWGTSSPGPAPPDTAAPEPGTVPRHG